MPARRSWVLALSVVAALLVLTGCDALRGCGANKIAELIDTSHKVQRDYAEKQEQWRDAGKGDTFILNDGVRTAKGSGAKVRFLSGGGVELGELTRIRFVPQAPGRGEHRVMVEAGEATLEGGGAGLQINTHIGLAFLEAGSSARVNVDGDTMRFMVVVGQAVIDGSEQHQLSAGEGFLINVGGVILERVGGEPVEAPDELAEQESDDSELQVVLDGRAARVRQPSDDQFVQAQIGELQLAPETQVDLPRGASMQITRGPEHVTVSGPAKGTIAPSSGALMALRAGGASVQGGSHPVMVDLPGGKVTQLAGEKTGSSQLDVKSRYSDVSVTLGSSRVDGKDTGADLSAGDKVRLMHNGQLEVMSRIPRFADLSIPAGESATVHDTAAPTAIRIRFPAKCSGQAMVEVSKQRGFSSIVMNSPGKESAIVGLAPGASYYRVRCLGEGGVANAKAVASGQVRVLRDAGAQPIPKRAPRNTVEADGRRYTVLYQNLLPQLTFLWTRAPGSPTGYTLTISRTGSGSPMTFKINTAQHTLEPGAVEEGTYEWWFETGDGKRSATTTLAVAFDNAAPAAFVREPSGTIPAGKSEVLVAGIAVEGAKVSVNGNDIPMDSQLRFSGMVALQGDDRALAIRISQAQYGVHYYLRSIAQK